MDFGEAIKQLKQGRKVARKGWNGKEQYIELASNISYKNSNKKIINTKHKDIGNKAIAFVGTSGVQMGWLASQADMLADDWIIKEEKNQHIYIPNPIQVEAFELKKGEKFPIWFETNKQIRKLGLYPETGIVIEIDTYLGKQTIYEGDYVIKDGEYIYALPALVFEEKYKKVEG